MVRQTAFLCFIGIAAFASGLHGAPSASEFLREGDAAIARSEWTAAIRHYSAAIEADEKAVLAYAKRAAAHSGLGDHKAALRDLGSALELEPSSVQMHLQRGRLRRSLCEFAGAESDFRSVLAIKPTHSAAEKELDNCSRGLQSLELARMAKETGDAAATRAELTTLFELAAHCTEAKLFEAALLLAEHDYGGVAAITGQVLKAEPGNREALLARSKAYFYLGDLDMAKRHLGELLKYDPDDTAAMDEFRKIKKLVKAHSKGDAAFARGDLQEAEKQLIAALWVDTTAEAVSAPIWLSLCKVQVQLEKGEEALKACAAAARRLKESAEPKVLKVRALLLDKQFDAAIAEARAAWDAHRGDRSVHQVLQEAERAKRKAESKDYYAILGVAPDASQRDIKQAYRHMAKRLHPDKALAEGIPKEEAEKKFHDIAEAYEVLSDEDKRARFDAGEDIEVQEGHNPFNHPFQQGGFHFQQGGFGGGQQHFSFHFG